MNATSISRKKWYAGAGTNKTLNLNLIRIRLMWSIFSRRWFHSSFCGSTEGLVCPSSFLPTRFLFPTRCASVTHVASTASLNFIHHWRPTGRKEGDVVIDSRPYRKSEALNRTWFELRHQLSNPLPFSYHLQPSLPMRNL